ncbi:MAG: ATP-binding cassette domain-containing protein [Candidatus Omnitrophota bacterium]|nr:ATP-binding cassette domain-containing protein [Candidatus Omnitrophota bacterium]
MHLNKSFGIQRVLNDINLDIASGEILVVMGESGSGKTVFLQHLIGLLKPDTGAIEIDGQNIIPLTEKELLKIRKGIGYLFQEGALYDFMTVFENLSFPLQEHTKLTNHQIREKVKEIISVVGLKGAEEKYPSQLSGGMKKRAALARAIILDSKILLCDEPTSGLDPQRSRDISDLILGISRKFSSTTVVTSHDITNSFRIADRLALIKDGQIIALGTKKELESSEDQEIKRFLLKI